MERGEREGSLHTFTKWPIREELILVSVARNDLEYFYFFMDGMLVHCRVMVTSNIKSAGADLYPWVKRRTIKVNCPAQDNNAVPWPGLEPGLFHPESSTLTIRPPHLPTSKMSAENQFTIGKRLLLYLHNHLCIIKDVCEQLRTWTYMYVHYNHSLYQCK